MYVSNKSFTYSSWKSLLPKSSGEMKTRSAKWWFHLYALCKEFVSKEDSELIHIIIDIND